MMELILRAQMYMALKPIISQTTEATGIADVDLQAHHRLRSSGGSNRGGAKARLIVPCTPGWVAYYKEYYTCMQANSLSPPIMTTDKNQ